MSANNPPSPSPLEDHLGFWLRFLSNHVSARFQKQLEEVSASVPEWVALRLLYDGEITSHAGLIEALGMTKGAASKLLARLEEKGLLGRRLAEDSAKTQVLALSEAGRALVPRLAALADENDAHFFGHLAPEARQALAEQLRQLVAHHQLKDTPIA